MTRLLRLPEVCERLGIKRSTVYAKIASGEIKPPVKLGKTATFPEDEIEKFIQTRRAERDERLIEIDAKRERARAEGEPPRAA